MAKDLGAEGYIDKEFPLHDCQPGPVRLAVKNLSRGNKVRDVSFELPARREWSPAVHASRVAR